MKNISKERELINNIKTEFDIKKAYIDPSKSGKRIKLIIDAKGDADDFIADKIVHCAEKVGYGELIKEIDVKMIPTGRKEGCTRTEWFFGGYTQVDIYTKY